MPADDGLFAGICCTAAVGKWNRPFFIHRDMRLLHSRDDRVYVFVVVFPFCSLKALSVKGHNLLSKVTKKKN